MFFKQFEDIEAWKCSRIFVKKIYLLTNTHPIVKDYGLKDQLQRASVSMMLNIAEGFDSKSDPAFINFLRYSYRSSAEVKSILYIVLDLNYIDQEKFKELTDNIKRIQSLISGLISSLVRKVKN
jgi:four helix bundle protein